MLEQVKKLTIKLAKLTKGLGLAGIRDNLDNLERMFDIQPTKTKVEASTVSQQNIDETIPKDQSRPQEKGKKKDQGKKMTIEIPSFETPKEVFESPKIEPKQASQKSESDIFKGHQPSDVRIQNYSSETKIINNSDVSLMPDSGQDLIQPIVPGPSPNSSQDLNKSAPVFESQIEITETLKYNSTRVDPKDRQADIDLESASRRESNEVTQGVVPQSPIEVPVANIEHEVMDEKSPTKSVHSKDQYESPRGENESIENYPDRLSPQKIERSPTAGITISPSRLANSNLFRKKRPGIGLQAVSPLDEFEREIPFY